jgi:predicted ATP-dependent endonuclease of OLD family
MKLAKIHIENYRNFHNTDIELNEGVNVVVGANNTGKSNLLRVIMFLHSMSVFDIDDFNKNDLHKNFSKYKTVPPIIKIRYEIEHIIDFHKVDSTFEKLEKFLTYDEDGNINEADNTATLHAVIELRFEIDPKFLDDYKNAMNETRDFASFYQQLKLCVKDFSPNYYNVDSETQIDGKFATSIFEVEKIEADRRIEEIESTSKSFVSAKIGEIEDVQDLTKAIKDSIQDKCKDITSEINKQIEQDQDEIGIINGKNKFSSSFDFDGDFKSYFHYELKDTELDYSLPINHNGLGYNNLIYIMNKIKQKKDNDYNILLIEEPEAHLHPNMQYKLIKYIDKLKKDDERNIQNQIIITTHSPNISASTNFDDMILFNYERNNDEVKNVETVRFGNNFDYDKVSSKLNIVKLADETDVKFNKFKQEVKNNLAHYRNHLAKFLDITRSDILFSSKVILVEGLAEKLTMPLWARLLNDENIDLTKYHIVCVEVGGINFNNFLPTFIGQVKKAACFRDCDFSYGKNDIFNYTDFVKEKIKDFRNREFQKNNFFEFFTQRKLGSTFETELFLENFDEKTTYKYLMKIAELPDCLQDFIEEKNIEKFHNAVDTISNANTKSKLKPIIDCCWAKYDTETDSDKKKIIEKIFFTVLFYEYVKDRKGDFALELATNKNIKIKPVNETDCKDTEVYLTVPTYIKEGLEWLLK